MKGYVVTLIDMPQSVSVAKRCCESAKKYGIEVEMFPAVDKNSSVSQMELEGLSWIAGENKKKYLPPSGGFDTYSNTGAVLGNFISQYRIWKIIRDSGESGIVLEHDAVFIDALPDLAGKGDIINIGIPSYGSYKQQKKPGVYPMFSKPGGYIPGAHGYYVTNQGAQQLVEKAGEIGAAPVDIFLNKRVFPEIKELWPQIVEAQDTFTTIQIQKGCEAKRSYRKLGKDYQILT